jgi:hypothetical protein
VLSHISPEDVARLTEQALDHCCKGTYQHTMSKLHYFDYEGFGERNKKNLNYSQAVRIGDRIEISSQGILYHGLLFLNYTHVLGRMG